MQWLLDLLGNFAGLFGADGYSELMPGSSFHALVAAFATQGYWVHADMLYLIGATQFQHFAVLIYMIAIIGGMIGMALGSPPKMYLWFFMGPAVFHFLIGTTQPVMGVSWKVAGRPEDQKEVWKLAEIGLANTNIAEREGLIVSAYSPPSGGLNGNGTVNVSYLFAQFDGLVSDTVQSLIRWLGVYNLTGSSDADSNRLPRQDPDAPSNVSDQSRWYLLSNLKWGYLDTITSARLGSPELRDAFVTFLAGSCGDSFYSSVDPTRYATVANSKSGRLEPGIFKSSGLTSQQYASTPIEAYKDLNVNLQKQVPFPISLRRLFGSELAAGSTGSGSSNATTVAPRSLTHAIGSYTFPDIIDAGGNNLATGDLKTVLDVGQIRCSTYLDILVRGFRWEAGLIMQNISDQIPAAANKEATLAYAMLYGWAIKELGNDVLFKDNIQIDEIKKQVETAGTRLTDIKSLQQFIINLITINLLKNEFMIAPNNLLKGKINSSVDQAATAVEAYQKTVGSRNKFGEVYTWAMMMPYMQGVLLYLLALGYPFACMFVLIPGWHKIIFTWMSFWVWAKIWDVGFAIVTIVERSIWSTLGNSAKAMVVNPYIAQMAKWSTVATDDGKILITDATGGVPGTFISYQFLDRAMTLFSNMDLDLQNSYYIYIMAALYFAVPAVTGQLVLGAKSGVAGLVTNAFTQMAQETGSKAGAAYSADLQQRYNQAAAASDQAFRAKAMMDRKNPLSAGAFAQKAFEGEFMNTMNSYRAAELKEHASGIQATANMINHAMTMNKGNLGIGMLASGMASSKFGQSGNPLLGYFAPSMTDRGFDFYTGQLKLGQVSGDLTGFSQQVQQASNNVKEDPNATQTQGVVGRGVGAQGSGSGQSYNPANITAGNVNGGGGQIVAGNAAFGWLPATATRFFTGDYGSLSDLTTQVGNNTFDYINSQAGRMSTANASELSIQSWQMSRESERQGIMANRYKSVAQGMMQDETYFQKAAYSSQVAPTLSAMGVQVQGPGAKSDDYMYMAASGLGGTFTTDKATFDGKPVDTINFANDGNFLSGKIGSSMTDLKGSYGFAALQSVFNQHGLSTAQAMNLAWARSGAIFASGQDPWNLGNNIQGMAARADRTLVGPSHLGNESNPHPATGLGPIPPQPPKPPDSK